jgi:hypothetical protein
MLDSGGLDDRAGRAMDRIEIQRAAVQLSSASAVSDRMDNNGIAWLDR